MTQKRIKIIDNISGEILYEDVYKNMDLVYAKATEYEELGLDIQIQTPSVSESLIRSLGASDREIADLRQESLDEIESHNKPTCTTSIQKDEPLKH